MGEYIYRRTSKVSIISLPNGERVQAIHIDYAYKPYLSWSGDAHNKRMRATATMHAKTATAFLAKKGIDASQIKYAVTTYKGDAEGGTVLRWVTGVPLLMSDYWENRVVGVLRDGRVLSIEEDRRRAGQEQLSQEA